MDEIEKLHKKLIAVNGTANEQANQYSSIARELLKIAEELQTKNDQLTAHIKQAPYVEFIYEDGAKEQYPILAEIRGTTRGFSRPIEYRLSYLDDQHEEWRYLLDCSIAPKKNLGE